MDQPLKNQLREKQQEHHSSTPLKKSSFIKEDRNGFANSSLMDSPIIDKEKMARHSQTSKDEFWDALSSNYDYLMDDGLIATCREASSDLSFDDENDIPESFCWSFTRFIEQFKYLHDLLHRIQVEKEECGSKCNPAILEEQQNVAYLCKLFNEQAQKLSKRYPDMKDEVHRHLNLLNNKWEAVEQSINPNKGSPSKDGAFDEITNRMRFLRKGLRDLENRLCFITDNSNWSVDDLEEKLMEQQILQREIEAKGKYVSSLLKLCEHLRGNICLGQNSLSVWDPERVRRVANNIQSRWHSLWLKSVECRCKLEELMKSYNIGNSDKLEKSFSEEPVKKYPRLSDNIEDILLMDNGLKGKMSLKSEEEFLNNSCAADALPVQQNGNMKAAKDELTSKNDKAVMVGATGITELKAECNGEAVKFEIVQDIGYSSETSIHYSTDEKLDVTDAANFNTSISNNHAMHTNSSESEQVSNGHCISLPEQSSKFYLAPDKYPSFPQKTWKEFLVEDQNLHSSKYNSCKSVPDEFYKVTSIDTEMFEDVPETAIFDDSAFGAKRIAKEQLTPTAAIEQNKSQFRSKTLELVDKVAPQCSKNFSSATKEKLSNSSTTKPNSLPNISPSNTIQRKSKRGSKPSIQATSPKPEQLNENSKRSARVVEWLSKCQSGEDLTSDDNFEPPDKSKAEWLHKNVVDSSCDASGEYTSESEKSGASDDVNNSVSFSQSFTGSIETVVPAVLEEAMAIQSERAGSAEPSPCVRMRKKKRVHRDRPWSVTEVRQAAFPQSVVPHSTSESALEKLFSQNARKASCAKKLCLDNKRPSMTNMSTVSCPNVQSSKSNADQSMHSRVTAQSCSSPEKPLSAPKRNNSLSDKSSDNCEGTLCVASENSLIFSLNDKKAAAECVKSLMGEDQTSAEELEQFEASANLMEQSCKELSSTSENNGSVKTKDEDITINAGELDSTINPEDHGSLSDQAWDEYQDPPYLSEPYSEQTADEDELKKLTNFGEDYRTILGSYSDTSSICARAPALKGRRRSRSRSSWKKSRSLKDSNFHSDSDSEDFHNVLANSHHALQFVSNSIKESTQKFSELSSEFDQLVATCQTNLCNLHEIHEGLLVASELESISEDDITKLQNLIKEWESMQLKVLSSSKKDKEQKPTSAEIEATERVVRCSMDCLKGKLSDLESQASQIEELVSSLQSLDDAILDLQAGLANLQELKQPVFSIRAQIHGLKSASGGGPAIILLHDDANKLYQQWENVYEIICSQLTKMQTLRTEWHQPTEKEISGDAETTTEFQGDSTLPKSQLSKDAFNTTAAAAVQIADLHSILMEIETEASLATIQYSIVDKKLEETALHNDPLRLRKSNGERRASSNVQDLLTSQKPTKSRLARMLRAALPIQIAIVVLYFMSCYMEPQCCENLNNYDFSIWPHLRYIRGPPPV